jgi:hypothetical protein
LTTISRTHRFTLAAVLCIAVLALVPVALAAKGGGGGHNKPGPTPTGSFSLVPLNSTDGIPHYGQQITFNVTSTATYYFVQVNCYQSGARVYNNTIGFYPGWPWSQIYYLESSLWAGGAATCNALLYSSLSDGTNQQTLATMSFDVAA